MIKRLNLPASVAKKNQLSGVLPYFGKNINGNRFIRAVYVLIGVMPKKISSYNGGGGGGGDQNMALGGNYFFNCFSGGNIKWEII